MTLSDCEWLSKIFNDTRSRAVSLRQLSFLLTSTVLRCSNAYWPVGYGMAFYERDPFTTSNFPYHWRCTTAYYLWSLCPAPSRLQRLLRAPLIMLRTYGQSVISICWCCTMLQPRCGRDAGEENVFQTYHVSCLKEGRPCASWSNVHPATCPYVKGPRWLPPLGQVPAPGQSSPPPLTWLVGQTKQSFRRERVPQISN